MNKPNEQNDEKQEVLIIPGNFDIRCEALAKKEKTEADKLKEEEKRNGILLTNKEKNNKKGMEPGE